MVCQMHSIYAHYCWAKKPTGILLFFTLPFITLHAQHSCKFKHIMVEENVLMESWYWVVSHIYTR